MRLTIYNTLGQKVEELVNTNLEAGWYNYQWNAGSIASGIYIYELRTDKFVSTKKMILNEVILFNLLKINLSRSKND